MHCFGHCRWKWFLATQLLKRLEDCTHVCAWTGFSEQTFGFSEYVNCCPKVGNIWTWAGFINCGIKYTNNQIQSHFLSRWRVNFTLFHLSLLLVSPLRLHLEERQVSLRRGMTFLTVTSRSLQGICLVFKFSRSVFRRFLQLNVAAPVGNAKSHLPVASLSCDSCGPDPGCAGYFRWPCRGTLLTPVLGRWLWLYFGLSVWLLGQRPRWDLL